MNGIVSRLQVFLAKIAGKDVDVSTLTPPVAINEEEKLMLDIADRIDAIEEGGGGGGGGGDTFVVTYTQVPDSPDNELTADKTISEIHAAIQSGANVIAKKKTPGVSSYSVCLLSGVVYQDEEGQTLDYIIFSGIVANYVDDYVSCGVETIFHYSDEFACEIIGYVTATPDA